MNLAILITVWLIVSFPIAILIGNCIFAGENERQTALSEDPDDYRCTLHWGSHD